MPLCSAPRILVALAFLGACTNVPELGERVPPDLRNAPYPALIPLDESLLAPQNTTAEAERLTRGLDARRARLEARARRLSAPVVDDETRARMQAGIAR